MYEALHSQMVMYDCLCLCRTCNSMLSTSLAQPRVTGMIPASGRTKVLHPSTGRDYFDDSGCSCNIASNILCSVYYRIAARLHSKI